MPLSHINCCICKIQIRKSMIMDMERNNTREYMKSFQEENEGLKRHIFQLESKLFTKTDTYRLVQQKSGKKSFTPDEIRQLKADINYVFDWLIKALKQSCSSLTEDDILFCCLTTLSLETRNLGHCMGTASRQAVNQRRYRVKKKMKKTSCEYLLRIIFLDIHLL